MHVRRDLVAAQVRHVPSYLVPPSLAAAGAAPKASFKRKKRSDRGGAKRRKGDTSSTRRKDNDPLQTFDSGGLDSTTPKSGELFEEAEEEPPRVFDERSPELSQSQSTAGRVAWKKAHKKGGFKPGGVKRLKKFSKGDGFRKKKF